MTRVLFLDIEGVLNSNFWNDSHQKEISNGLLIDADKANKYCGRKASKSVIRI